MTTLSSSFRNTYLKNIKEYYDNKSSNDIVEMMTNNDKYDRATYDLYKMMLENKPESDIDEQIKYVNSLPVPYWKMRSIFG